MKLNSNNYWSAEMIKQGFSLIALKKLNMMISRPDFVAVSSVSDSEICIQNKKSFQTINKYGRVTNCTSTKNK